MIFYFSGTGNSRYVAEQIADATNEELISITKEEMNKGVSYVLQDGESRICRKCWLIKESV